MTRSRALEEHAADAMVVWGNGEAVAEDLRAFGHLASLREWMTISRVGGA